MKRAEIALAKLQRQVDVWNAAWPVGSIVEYRRDPYSEPETFTTRTPAQILSGHTAVLWMSGKSGCVCLDALRGIPA